MRRALLAATPLPHRPGARDVVTVTLAALLALLVGALWVSKPIAILALIALVVALIAIWLAFTRPAIAFFGLVAAMALIPTYAAPEKGALLLVPAVVAGWAVGIVLGWRNLTLEGRVFRPTPIDFGVFAFVLLMYVSTQFSPRGTKDEFIHQMFLWIGPYLGARLLLVKTARPARLVALAFAVVTVVVAPIALAEYLGARNPFHVLDFNSTEFAVWAEQINRYGHVRAEASFGHPIALSMFAATSSLLSLAMGLAARGGKERWLWFGSAAIGVALQVLTVSRTGWLMLIAGVVLITFIYGRTLLRGRLTAIACGAATLFVLVSLIVPSALQALPGFEKETTQVNASSDYRERLLHRALEPGVLHFWGNATNQVTPFVEANSATDNAYIILADTWGLLPTFALIAVAVLMLGLIWNRRNQDRDTLLILPIVAFAGLLAIFFVDFITQAQCVLWLTVGCAAGASELLSAESKAREPAAQRAVALERM